MLTSGMYIGSYHALFHDTVHLTCVLVESHRVFSFLTMLGYSPAPSDEEASGVLPCSG